MLTPLQQDALKEFMNVSIGQAGSVLSEMVNQKIHLEVPEVWLLTSERIPEIEELDEVLKAFLQGHIVSSSLSFGNEFNGQARLIFPVNKGKLLVNMLLAEEFLPDDGTGSSGFSDTDTDAMKEIGNVLLNVIVGSLGNLLETKIEYSLPELEFLHVGEHDVQPLFGDGSYTLLIRNSFIVGETHIEGAIFVMLSMNSTEQLIKKIDETLVDFYE